MSRAEYVERVEFQRWLDEVFPRGAALTMMTLVEDRLLPGDPIVSARLFCRGARLSDEGSWEFEIQAEPVIDPVPGWKPEGDPGVPSPWRVWVPGLFPTEVPGLFEAPVIGDAGEELADVTLRVTSVLEGPRQIPERMREEQTARWEAEMFPEGLEV